MTILSRLAIPPLAFRLGLLALCLLSVPSMAEAPSASLPVPSMEASLGPLTEGKAWRNSLSGAQFVDVNSGTEVFARAPDRPLIAASTTKVLTSAAALKNLGPSYKFTTDLYVDGVLDGAGTLHGNLYVQGHGDPSFVVERMWKLIHDLHRDGVERVDGDVIFDDSFFQGPPQLVGWDKAKDVEEGPSYFATMGALSLNFNTVTLVVRPGPKVDGPAIVALDTPVSGYVELVNTVKTGPETAHRRLTVTREPSDGMLRFTVDGTVPAGADAVSIYRTVEDPTAHFIGAFMAMLGEQGVRLTGHARQGRVPTTARLVEQSVSPPLAAVLMDMNKYSNNFMAEQVLRTMGAESDTADGTTEGGLKVVQAYLAQLRLPDDSYHLVNGSGLSRDALISPSVLTAVLLDMAQDPRVGAEFRSSLAIAGADGTLRSRLRDEPARLRGKTGTIDGVHGLVGYMEAADGRLLAFALLSNDVKGGIAGIKQVHDAMARRVFGLNVGAEAVVEGDDAAESDGGKESP